MTVTAATPSLLTARGGGSTIRTADIERLPTGRTPSLVAELAPGLTNNTPNVNQVTISGAVAYDNVFLLDGVDIGDNLFARPDDLVRRGSHRRNAGADLGGVRRIRPLLRRRRQRRDQARRQPVFGQRPQQPVECGVDQRDAVREGRRPEAPGQDGPLLRGHVRRPAEQEPRVVLLCRTHAVERDQPDAGADRRGRSSRPTSNSAGISRSRRRR